MRKKGYCSPEGCEVPLRGGIAQKLTSGDAHRLHCWGTPRSLGVASAVIISFILLDSFCPLSAAMNNIPTNSQVGWCETCTWYDLLLVNQTRSTICIIRASTFLVRPDLLIAHSYDHKKLRLARRAFRSIQILSYPSTPYHSCNTCRSPLLPTHCAPQFLGLHHFWGWRFCLGA